jgi:hypothetical protein
MLENKDKIMKKLYSITFASSIAFLLLGCAGSSLNSNTIKHGTVSDAIKLDVKTACAPSMSPTEHLAVAKRFNPTAKKMKIEFMRFKVSNSKAIAAVEKAMKDGKKIVPLLKKKKYTLTSVKDAAWRTCVFAIRPLQLHHQAKTTAPLAIPGQGFKY